MDPLLRRRPPVLTVDPGGTIPADNATNGCDPKTPTDDRGGNDMTEAKIHAERYPARVAARFGNPDRARRAAERLLHDTDLTPRQVRLIDPTAPDVESAIEPENQGIWRTLVRSHVSLGLLGLLAGLVISGSLLLIGFPFAVSQAIMVAVSLGVFGLVIGLLVGGLVTLRPDHSRIYLLATDAARARQWVVIALAAGRAQRDHAHEVLSREADQLAQTV
jgi:hypothetical protein